MFIYYIQAAARDILYGRKKRIGSRRASISGSASHNALLNISAIIAHIDIKLNILLAGDSFTSGVNFYAFQYSSTNVQSRP